MPDIVLELILHNDTTYGSASELALPITNHVHKRIDKFIYVDDIDVDSIPLTYLENRKLDSAFNLQIANRTYSVPANSTNLSRKRSGFDRIVGRSYASPYKNVTVTNETIVDEQGQVKPLFFKHVLPDGVVQVELEVVTRGNKILLESGYRLDLDAGTIFTNYKNFYDQDTGAYRLHYVISTGSDGTTYHELLNPVPVAEAATWRDIDLDTGKLTTAYPVYTIEQATGGWNLYFNTTDTWYIKPIEEGLIQPLHPTGRDPDEPWFMKFTDGDVTAVANDRRRHYYVPEFDQQPFIPSKPTVYSPYTKMLRVNNNTLKATRDSLSIDADAGLHIDIFITDVDGVVIRALTTDSSKDSTRYADQVFWESDTIHTWDNAGGFISLGIDILASWDFYATYYYEAKDFEYNLISLNPATNKSIENHTVVYYAIPDVNVNDRAIHHLVVNHDGLIVATSQGPEGLSYPNLQLTDASGNYNSDTIIGKKYISDIETDYFLKEYTVGYDNTHAYMVLAEVAVMNIEILEDQFVVDARRKGNRPFDSELKNVFRANPRVLQSRVGYGANGQEVPMNIVMVIDAPLDLLEDYGGHMTEAEAEEALRTHMPSAGYAHINWLYPKTELSGWSNAVGQVLLEWTWEEPSLTYKVYRRTNPAGEKTLIHTSSSPPEGTISYTDTGLTTDDTYHYSVTIIKDGIEFPESNTLSVKVR